MAYPLDTASHALDRLALCAGGAFACEEEARAEVVRVAGPVSGGVGSALRVGFWLMLATLAALAAATLTGRA